MNKRWLAVGGVCATVIFSAGCSSTRVPIQCAATSPGADLTGSREIMGSGAGYQLFWCIPIRVNSRQARAYARLMAQAGGDRCTDLTIQETWRFLVVGNLHRTTFRARAWADGAGAPLTATQSGTIAPAAVAQPMTPAAPAEPQPAARDARDTMPVKPAVAKTAAPPVEDLVTRKMKELDKLKADGVISQAEYDRTVKRLLETQSATNAPGNGRPGDSLLPTAR